MAATRGARGAAACDPRGGVASSSRVLRGAGGYDASRMLSLTVIEGPDEGKRFQLPTDQPQLLGRSTEAIPITDNTVSRRHAELTPDGDVWYLRDLRSQNGTMVNGVPITGRIRLE